MSHTATRRPGRLRTLAVLAALSASMIAGAVPAQAAPPAHAAGFERSIEARAATGNFDFSDSDGFTGQGATWR